MRAIRTIAVLVSLAAIPAFADSWSFVVAGDGRTDPRHSPDPTGINTKVFTRLLRAVASDKTKPKFMIFTGDLVAGTRYFPVPLQDQFRAWKALVKAELPDMPVLPFRGNHEMYGETPDGKYWLEAFKPGLDAQKVIYLHGEEGFSYYYSAPGHPEVMVIALDQFIHLHRVNLVELEAVLKKARADHVSHVFAFAHEMAFTCTNHPDRENMAAFPEERDRFVDMLQSYGCEYFFAGHDHAYDWMAIRHPKWPANYVLNQVVAGTAGAPYYEDKGYFGDHHGYDLTRLDHKQNTPGYLLVVVDNGTGKVTVTFEALPSTS